jgi:hypothetical protein
MRPVTDKHQISRSKLAYLIDATAAPVCIIAPISSWAAAVSGTVQDDSISNSTDLLNALAGYSTTLANATSGSDATVVTVYTDGDGNVQTNADDPQDPMRAVLGDGGKIDVSGRMVVLNYVVTNPGAGHVSLPHYDITFDGQTIDKEFRPTDLNGAGNGDACTTTMTFSEDVMKIILEKGIVMQGHGLRLNKVILETPSGIKNVLKAKSNDGAIYNLAGQRVYNPQKGIYIKNGKKFIVK